MSANQPRPAGGRAGEPLRPGRQFRHRAPPHSDTYRDQAIILGDTDGRRAGQIEQPDCVVPLRASGRRAREGRDGFGDDILTSDPDDLRDLAQAAGIHVELIRV